MIPVFVFLQNSRQWLASYLRLLRWTGRSRGQYPLGILARTARSQWPSLGRARLMLQNSWPSSEWFGEVTRYFPFEIDVFSYGRRRRARPSPFGHPGGD